MGFLKYFDFLKIADPGPQLIGMILVGLALAMVYAVWFRSQRGALGFAWLIWLLIGIGIGPLLGQPGSPNVKLAILALAPWNLLLLAVLPATSLRRPGGIAVVAFWALQLILVFLAADGERPAHLAGMNVWLLGQLPGAINYLISSVEEALIFFAMTVFFIRWQVSGRPNELGLFLATCVMLAGIMENDYLPGVLVPAGSVLLLFVFYSTHRMAFFDALTGIHNRRSMDAAMANLGGRYAIAMLDIDHFKRVNDRFGHDFGDQVLKMVATRVRRVRRFRLYRYGGEEFCLVFMRGAADQAEDICEAVRIAVGERPIVMRSLQRPQQKPAKKRRSRQKVPSVKVTVSIGLARPSDRNASPEQVRESADKALFRAKKKGRDRVERAR